jgi:rSAM/selenodomain-associated transferase 2
MSQMLISVIIPTLNEEEHIRDLLVYLKKLDKDLELIIADAGSTDQTVEQAWSLARVVESALGRGVQMNRGAAVAQGQVLWFLHADCRPHAYSVQLIGEALSDPEVVGGGFEYALDHPGFRFRLIEFLSNRKNRRLGWLFGDMGIFVRRDIFEEMHGYKDIPLMEDMDFSKRLKLLGKVVILPQRIMTSSRRWLEEGYLFNSLRSWALQSAWVLGASPQTLAKWYRFK